MSRKATRKRGRRVVAVSDDEAEPMVGSSTGIVGSSTGAAATEEVPRRPIKRQRAHDDGEISPAKVSTGPSTVGSADAPPSVDTPAEATAPEEIVADGTAVNEDEKFGALAPKQRTRFQASKHDILNFCGASVRMNKAREHFPTIQKAVLSSFTHKDLGDACSCGAEATYRCTDCFKGPMNCQKCIVQSHEHTPFHRIESWNGKHFARTSLHAAGMILHMCFKATNGASCPHNSSRFRKRQVMTLGEENGFHDVEIEYCSCQTSDAVDQLLAVNLLPSSFSTVQTVFTWTVMKRFHIHCLASKKSAYDYVKALCKLTDNAAYSQVTDRYREFQFGYRIWRFLALERRTGQAHGIDKFVPHRRPGSLTVRCPACPEVGFNVDEETINNADESEKHKYTLFISMDGNFKLQRKNKRDDPDDVALNAGAGYFVETEEYKRYVALAKPVDDPNTCSQFEAARMQNIAKFKNAVISGVVAVQCARHGFYLPQGMVDLTKGEAFAKTDYALAYALGEASLIRWIMATYDIWCQYSIKLKERFGDWFPSMLDIMNKIRGAIPKMHIHGHMLLCLILWNLNFIRWSGFTVGELIETSWVEQNLTAGSTREQNDGNRHDSVDDTSGNWNWDKMVGLAQTLQRLYRIAKAELVKRSENFDAVNAKHPDTLIAEWEAMDPVSKMVPEDPKDKTNKKMVLSSVFQAKFKKGEHWPNDFTNRKLILAQAYAKLLNEELDKVSDITASSVSDRKAGDSVLITVALMLEKDQHYVRRMIAKHAEEDLITAARRRVYNSITDLRTKLVARIPSLKTHIHDVNAEKPEKEALFLPSQFPAPTRTELNMEALAQVEFELRRAQAFDALAEARTAIRTLSYNLEMKKSTIHGVGANTKAQNFLKTLHNDVNVAADTYRRARAALVMLGTSEDDPVLKPLAKEDLTVSRLVVPGMGDAKKQESWIWTTGRGVDLTEAEVAEWEAEMERVKWFRDRALRDRAVEETELLEAEFLRTITWFEKTADVWNRLGDEATDAGPKAYAYKQATMYSRFKDDTQKAWAEVPAMIERDRKKEESKERARQEERKAAKAKTTKKGKETGEQGELDDEDEDDTDFEDYYDTLPISKAKAGRQQGATG
ncbi:hypothetical protein B0H12DRAFT_1076022 [Mycena haematopus]|nr:hypothetical protein B0H12DRAFT_1076022 [Mycena haematopus]